MITDNYDNSKLYLRLLNSYKRKRSGKTFLKYDMKLSYSLRLKCLFWFTLNKRKLKTAALNSQSCSPNDSPSYELAYMRKA